MSIFDRFAKPKPPRGYSGVKVEFTEEESEAVDRTLKRYAASGGPGFVVPQKVKDGMIARGLVEYVEGLIDSLSRLRSSDSEKAVTLMDKAVKALMKAYAIHNLPVYLFQIAGTFELLGDAGDARESFGLFLQVQNNFKPDQIDTLFLSQAGFDIPKIVAMAREKTR